MSDGTVIAIVITINATWLAAVLAIVWFLGNHLGNRLSGVEGKLGTLAEDVAVLKATA